jgi:phage shock protein A
MRLFPRLRNLVRGLAARWMSRRERNNPEAVYEAAIHQRLDQYGQLRAAAAGVLYMRSKLGTQLEAASSELGRVRRELDLAVERDDDEVALALLARRDRLAAEVERLGAELTELTAEAETAKRNLVGFQDEIVRLRDEKVRMLARLAHAQARLRLQETLDGLSPDADIQALDSVRTHIEQQVAEVHLSREVADVDLERRLVSIRDAERVTAAQAQLEELKRARKPALLTAAGS